MARTRLRRFFWGYTCWDCGEFLKQNRPRQKAQHERHMSRVVIQEQLFDAAPEADTLERHPTRQGANQ